MAVDTHAYLQQNKTISFISLLVFPLVEFSNTDPYPHNTPTRLFIHTRKQGQSQLHKSIHREQTQQIASIL